VVDFHKNCEAPRRKVLGLSGTPVYYHRCPACQFIFTTAFDHFTQEDFRTHIYNDAYRLVDPDYDGARARGNAAWLCGLFSRLKPPRLLDYGGGEGLLIEVPRTAGFPHVETYDPFVPRHATRPRQRFECVVSFEVAEHSTDPRGTFEDINSLLADDGVVIFSTMIQPADIDRLGLNWWYVAPRNGHVSLFSRASLLQVARPFGFSGVSFNDNRHALYRTIPEFARKFIKIGGDVPSAAPAPGGRTGPDR
jgi:2-polyprenyl-6-hydroxyphenyl methylase/3-demethylubiquinone-9 3-methyltransferase